MTERIYPRLSWNHRSIFAVPGHNKNAKMTSGKAGKPQRRTETTETIEEETAKALREAGDCDQAEAEGGEEALGGRAEVSSLRFTGHSESQAEQCQCRRILSPLIVCCRWTVPGRWQASQARGT